MRSRALRFFTMMTVAAGVPYAWFNDNVAGSIKGGWQRISGGNSRGWSSSPWPLSLGNSSATSSNPNAPAINTPVHHLAQVLRFDITPRFVTDSWPRVSTVTAERDLVGMRVPLVTGTNLDDLAGSLTYYFNANQQLCRITLHAHTGDDRTIVDAMTKHFGMHTEPSLAAGVYLLRWNAKPMNVMRVSHSPVVRADSPHEKFIVELELNDVRSGYGMSQEFNSILAPDAHVRAWNT